VQQDDKLTVLWAFERENRATSFQLPNEAVTVSYYERDEHALDPDTKKLRGVWLVQKNANSPYPVVRRAQFEQRIPFENAIQGTLLGIKSRDHPRGRPVASIHLSLDSKKPPNRVSGSITRLDEGGPRGPERISLQGVYKKANGKLEFRLRYEVRHGLLGINKTTGIWGFRLARDSDR
jgi:hypothetical protein